jgi:hypothetical protein
MESKEEEEKKKPPIMLCVVERSLCVCSLCVLDCRRVCMMCDTFFFYVFVVIFNIERRRR